MRSVAPGGKDERTAETAACGGLIFFPDDVARRLAESAALKGGGVSHRSGRLRPRSVDEEEEEENDDAETRRVAPRRAARAQDVSPGTGTTIAGSRSANSVGRERSVTETDGGKIGVSVY